MSFESSALRESVAFIYGSMKSTELYRMYFETRENQPLNWEAADDIYRAFLAREKAESSVGIYRCHDMIPVIEQSHNEYINSMAGKYRDIYRETVMERPADHETEEIVFNAFRTFADGRNIDREIIEDVEKAREQFNRKRKLKLIWKGLGLIGQPSEI